MRTALTITQIETLLQATIPLLETELQALPEPLTRWRPAAGEWSINEVIGHLIEAEERGFGGRIRRIMTQPGYTCEPWDPDQVACDRRDNERAAPALLAELAARRAQSLALVTTLSAAQLQCSAEHPAVGNLRVSDLLHEWVYHDRNHLKQIMGNLQAWIWPAMGNAQRFSQATALHAPSSAPI